MFRTLTLGNKKVGDGNFLMFDILSLIIFILPAYVANAAPVLLGGGIRLDLGKNFFDGKPIFGETKTIRGFLSAVLAGTVIAGVLSLYLPIPLFSTPALAFRGGIALALGAITGDAIGSFFKRRMGMESGRPFFPDAVIFLAFALLFVIPFVSATAFSLENMVFLFGITILLHPATNFLANRIGLKKVPW
jgi:CDP-2,3-bis-(O-geranylgeranyl)-sn-glycerol synthase